MRMLCFLLIACIFTGKAYASDNFVLFEPEKSVISFDNELNVTLNFEIVGAKSDRFRFRPIADVGGIQIWDPSHNVWVSSKASWIDMPTLSSLAKLKFLNNAFFKTKVYFLVQDAKTATIYETNDHFIWSRRWVVPYILRLNKNIFRMVKYSNEDF